MSEVVALMNLQSQNKALIAERDALQAEVKACHAENHLKADVIDKMTNDSAADMQTITEQAAEIERLSASGIPECMDEATRLRKSTAEAEVIEQAHMLLCFEFQPYMKPPSQTDGRYEESMKVWNLEPLAKELMCAARADLYDALMNLKGGDS